MAGLVMKCKLLLRDWRRLNRLQMWLVLEHPVAALEIRRLAHVAWEEEVRRFLGGSPSMDLDGPGDAFRHCYWSALITRTFGAKLAREATDAYENIERPDYHVVRSREGYSVRSIRSDSRMDLHNNEVGVQIGLELRTATEEELADRCEEAVRSGRCVVLRP